MTIDLVVEQGGERLDRYLAERLSEHSRAEVQRWIRDGDVLLNDAPARVSARVAVGDHVRVNVPAPQPSTLAAEAIPLVILYEDDDLIAVDKPAGMVVHPAPGHATGTLVNAILHHCPDLKGVGGVQRPGIVHRLDKDTSGIILVAKNDQAHRHLQAQFKRRTVEKTYLALLLGHLEPERGRIDAPIGRHPRQRKRMAVVSAEQGRVAATDFEIIAFYGNHTLVAAHPLTGRTHQIRVHFASLGRPVVGDTIYGPRKDALHLGRQFLHAHRLCFDLPATGERLELSSPLPPDLQAVLDRLAQ